LTGSATVYGRLLTLYRVAGADIIGRTGLFAVLAHSQVHYEIDTEG
jgi:hypothetical protein